jgi:hypothetical protein
MAFFILYDMKIQLINFFIKVFTAIVRFSKKRLTALYELKYFTEFEERPDDIYIVTYPKSGTTWMQMILYTLIYQKEPDFKHIYDVSPWLSNEAFKHNSCEKVNKLPSPRFFKSHDPYEKFTPGFEGKIIYVYRDVLDLAVSYFYHKKHYNNPDIMMDELLEDSFNETKNFNWFTFHKNWLENKHNYPVFYISYEDLKTDFEGAVIQIARYLKIELTTETIELAKKYASFEYMKAHEEKFGEQPENNQPMVYNQFIRKGNIGEGKAELTDEQKKYLLSKYEEHIAPLINRQ